MFVSFPLLTVVSQKRVLLNGWHLFHSVLLSQANTQAKYAGTKQKNKEASKHLLTSLHQNGCVTFFL